ncbi:MAG: hypothetical protein ACXAD7_15000 [Candidatus Kariarchaeaceae archaeon]
MRYSLLLVVILICTLHIHPTSASSEVEWKAIQVTSIYAPMDKPSMTITIEGILDLSQVEFVPDVKLKVTATTNERILIDSIDSKGKFHLEFEHELLAPGSYTDFVTLSSDQLDVTPHSFPLTVYKDSIQILSPSQSIEYNEVWYVNGTINHNNQVTQHRRVNLRFLSVISTSDGIPPNIAEGEDLSSGFIYDGYFNIRVIDKLPLGSYLLQLEIDECEYYNGVNQSVAVHVGKAAAKIVIVGANEYNVMDYQDTMNIITQDQHDREISNIMLSISSHNGLIQQSQVSNGNGMISVDLTPLANITEEKTDFTEVILDINPNSHQYYFKNQSVIIRIYREEDDPLGEIIDQLKGNLADFGDYALLKTMGLIGGFLIMSDRYNRKKKKLKPVKK